MTNLEKFRQKNPVYDNWTDDEIINTFCVANEKMQPRESCDNYTNCQKHWNATYQPD